MAEPEVATKASESDAQEAETEAVAETSLFPGDTPAQTGASLGVRRVFCDFCYLNCH